MLYTIFKLESIYLWSYFSKSRPEMREGYMRPLNKEYYFIDFHATIDAIKYRIFRLTQQVKEIYKPSEEKKDYRCPRCQAQWTQLEVIDNASSMGEFLCHRCGGVLERDEPSAADAGGHEKLSKLMSQLDRFLKMLQEIDSKTIPNNDFETAFSLAVPVQRNELINPTRTTVPVQAAGRNGGPPAAVKGLTQATMGPLEISVTTSSAKTAAEQEAETRRKAELAAQNALPVWHTNSTVTGETTNLGSRGSDRLVHGGTIGVLKDDVDEKKGVDVLNDELAAYYAQMQEEKEKEVKEDNEAETDDEGDEFEDVGVTDSGVATPSSSMSAVMNGRLDGRLHDLAKTQESESGSSVPETGISTPAASFTVEPDETEPVAKRMKAEVSANGVNGIKPSTETGADKVSDEDEDEFEDAL